MTEDRTFEKVFQEAPMPGAVLDLQGRFLRINRAFCHYLGYPEPELMRLSLKEITYPGDPYIDQMTIKYLLAGRGAAVPLEKRFVRADGSVVWAAVRASVIHDDAGTPTSLAYQCHDITARREYELLWRKSFRDSAIGMAILDLTGNWVSVNDALCNMLGYWREELLARPLCDVVYPTPGNGRASGFADLVKGHKDSVQVEQRYRHADGHPVWLLVRASVVTGPDERPAFLFCQYEEIGDQRLVDARHAHLALHDSLTGVANRALLDDRLEHALGELRRCQGVVAVITADLDGLKEVNDRHGHLAGDQLLIATAQILTHVVRAGDTVCRLGGDEFVIVSRVATKAAACALRDRIIDCLHTMIPVLDHVVPLRASVGLATTASATTPPQDLLHQADQSMYLRKRKRQNAPAEAHVLAASSANWGSFARGALLDVPATEHPRSEMSPHPNGDSRGDMRIRLDRTITHADLPENNA